MGDKCCVRSCISREGVDNVTFHSFPVANWKKINEWMELIDRQKVLQGAKICGYHFKNKILRPEIKKSRTLITDKVYSEYQN